MTVYWSHESSCLSVLSCSPAWAQGTALKKSLAAKHSWYLAMRLMQEHGIGVCGTVAAPKQEIQRFWFGCMCVCAAKLGGSCCHDGWYLFFCQRRVIAVPSHWLADIAFSLSCWDTHFYSDVACQDDQMHCWMCDCTHGQADVSWHRGSMNHGRLQLSVWLWAHHIANLTLCCRWTFNAVTSQHVSIIPCLLPKWILPSFHYLIRSSWFRITNSCRMHTKGALDGDVAIMGIPCPLFSKLNGRKRSEGFNPFRERLGWLGDWDPPYHILQCKLGKVWQFMVHSLFHIKMWARLCFYWGRGQLPSRDVCWRFAATTRRRSS